MIRPLSAIVFVLLLAGCSAVPRPHPSFSAADLLDGQALFGETVSTDEASVADMLAVSPEMQQFVDRMRSSGGDRMRMEQLLRGMHRAGYFDVVYDANITLTAAETFKRRTGNCLSYTSLFIALARAMGLDARFEVVVVPPIWDSVGNWVILNTHINALVRGVRISTLFERDFVVDFNTEDYRGTFKRHVVSDATAAALFLSNRGVEALRAGEMRTAFASFKRAIAYDARVTPAWVNLGALYSHSADYDRAAAAYEHAVAVDPLNKPALTNLSRLYDQLGQRALAEQYRQRIRAYEDANPYFHYSLAQRAYLAADYPLALEQIKRAIALKKGDDRLYFLQGLIHYRTGDLSAAQESLARAQRYSSDTAQKERYAEKLEVLARATAPRQ